MKSKSTLKSLHELSAAGLGPGHNHRPSGLRSSSTSSGDERARQPLVYSMALIQATTDRGLRVRMQAASNLSVATG